MTVPPPSSVSSTAEAPVEFIRSVRSAPSVPPDGWPDHRGRETSSTSVGPSIARQLCQPPPAWHPRQRLTWPCRPKGRPPPPPPRSHSRFVPRAMQGRRRVGRVNSRPLDGRLAPVGVGLRGHPDAWGGRGRVLPACQHSLKADAHPRVPRRESWSSHVRTRAEGARSDGG